MIWPMTIGEVVRSSGRRFPDRVALVSDSENLTYSQLDEMATCFARGLVEKGVRHGDRIAVMLPNAVSFIVAFYGVAKAGAVFVPISEKLKPFEVANLLSHCQPKVFIADSPTEDLAHAAAGTEIVIGVSANAKCATALKAILKLGERETELPKVIDQDWAAILYTSGTTGAPKGAILTHLNMVSSCRGMVSVFGFSNKDRGLVFLPLAHIFATWMHITHLMVGAYLVIQRRFSREATIDALKRHRITTFCAVPSILMALVNEPEFSNDAARDLRCVISGGALLSNAVWERLLEVLPKSTGLFDAYGQTETVGASIVCDRTMVRDSPGVIGRPVPYIRVRLMNEDGAEVERGAIGEIAIQGSKVMQGYFDNREATEQALRTGYYWTGDLARMDGTGCIHLVGRKKDFIIRGGLNVFPQEIEQVLAMHPGVDEAAVLGVPDPFYGEIIKGVVVPSAGHHLDDGLLREWCSKHLADYKIPSIIEIRNELPRNEAGKVVKRLLA